MNGLKIGRETNLEKGKEIVGLKSTAYKEYLAARHLLNDNFLHQATFFINTCIEKELKAYFFAMNATINIKHDIFKLFNLLNQIKPEKAKNLNCDFMKVVSKIYKSRYYEGLGAGYNFVIIKNKFLAELDYTFSILEPMTRYKLGRDEEIYPTEYEKDKNNNDPILYRNNYLLNRVAKQQFLNQPDLVYEFRIAKNHEVLEVYYQIPFNKEHDRFIYEGMKQTSETSFQISNHHPPAP